MVVTSRYIIALSVENGPRNCANRLIYGARGDARRVRDGERAEFRGARNCARDPVFEWVSRVSTTATNGDGGGSKVKTRDKTFSSRERENERAHKS